jgi:hypothetical protein
MSTGWSAKFVAEMRRDSAEEILLQRVLLLVESVWRNGIREPDIDNWLAHFDGSATGDVRQERLCSLHLLSEFTYFGLRELRVLLKAGFLEHVARPALKRAREAAGGGRDMTRIRSLYSQEISRTRFLGVGNPSDSGSHLLYYFRQETGLSKELFISSHEIFDGPVSEPSTAFREPELTRLVFIDDLLGSGQQATEYSATILRDVRAVASRLGKSVELVYLVLFAKPEGLAHARGTLFDRVCAVHELADADMAFTSASRAFRKPPSGVDFAASQTVATHYGARIWPSFPLGYRNGQLMLGFHHNVPDNSLPIFWKKTTDWTPILPRYMKV